LSYDILKDFKLGKERKANLSLTFHHDRVDPLFRSIAAYVQADRLNNQFEIAGSIGEITGGFSLLYFKDNLDDIRSILKTLTRRTDLSLGAPLASLFGMTVDSSAWLPRLAFSYNRTHQFGAFLPVNGDFTRFDVPDLVSTDHNFNARWEQTRWSFGYRFNRSLQNNRQPGRERVDLENTINSFTFGFAPYKTFDLDFDLNAEQASDL
jgi:hypothetical protein